MQGIERVAVSLAEAGRALGVSRTTVSRQAQRGSIKVLKLGRRILISVDELHRLLDQGPRK